MYGSPGGTKEREAVGRGFTSSCVIDNTRKQPLVLTQKQTFSVPKQENALFIRLVFQFRLLDLPGSTGDFL